MISLNDKIMKRVRARGSGNWVCTPKDFLNLGSRPAIDQALSRLAKAGKLRRVGRGLYDSPRMSPTLNRLAPTNLDAAVQAVARRDNVRIMPSGIAAAHKLGLTTAVPAKADYLTNGGARTVTIDGWTVRLRQARRLMDWQGRPAATAVQALQWLGQRAVDDPQVVTILQRRLSSDVKSDLDKGKHLLPVWLLPVVDKITGGRDAAA